MAHDVGEFIAVRRPKLVGSRLVRITIVFSENYTITGDNA